MKPLVAVNKYFLRYKWLVLGGIVFIFLANYYSVYPAQALRDAIDTVNEAVGNEDDQSGIILKLFWFTAAIIGFSLLRGVFMFMMRQTLIVMSRRIEQDMKDEIFNHYQTLPMAFYKKNNTGDLMNRISEDVSRVRMYTGPALMYALNTIFTFILVIGAMFRVNASLTWYVIIPLPFLSILMYYVNDIINRKSEAIQEQLSDLTSYVQETISGIRMLKAFASEKRMQSRMETQILDYRTKQLSLAKTDALYFPVNLLLIGLSTLITIYIGGLQYIQGHGTLGNIAEFVFYVNMLTWPVSSLGWVTAIVQRAAASQKRINEFLETQSDLKSGTLKNFSFQEEISFDQISFTYPDRGITALSEVSFKLRKGKVLGITGHTGSGKSTIAQLLMRSYDPDAGEISVDGVPVRNYTLNAYRSRFGFVPQEVFLFSESIRNNIALASESELSEEVIEASAQKASVWQDIQEFRQGLDTMVGERGLMLSGGQKQRISIARALARNPDILVFDDCLSAVDAVTERDILSSIKEVIKEKTALIISHRVSSIQFADEILVIEHGKVVEQGTHANLIGMQGYYADLYKRQQTDEREPIQEV